MTKKKVTPTETDPEIEVPVEKKPRTAAKKSAKAAPLAEAAPAITPEAAKPAKKAPKKAKLEAPDAVAAQPEIEPVADKPEKATAKKAPAKKAPARKAAAKPVAKPDKGRDLVTDEPGAAEVAAILHPEDEDEEPKVFEAPVIPPPEPKLERLQKILAKAGISSRRKAEELILGGQVQINGKVVMELGTKADPSRDHIRVDGKLLQGPERIRYFVLNKPKGFVTTVSDPEGRPTVMQFFASERERLYPVGRLDYLSEGLLLVTNDGELANKLTKAASGVEKTYLVKVAGQPTEDMLDVLRAGVVIEKGRPGTNSGRVRTAPAQIRQVRQGDNPWYEVIIIEGRNRELRKMFEEIGHHVEKIRRIGYGPLILDLEPGKLRELEPEEVHSLRLAAEGKLKTRRRRGPKEAQLPTVAGKTVRYKKADGRPGYEPAARRAVRPEFEQESKSESPSARPEFKKAIRSSFKSGVKPAFKPAVKSAFKSESRAAIKPEFRKPFRPDTASAAKPGFSSGPKREFRPEFKREGKPEFKPAFKSGPDSASRPDARPGFKSAGRPAFGGKPRFDRPSRQAEPPVTDYILPPRKAGASEPEDSFNAEYKPGFRAGEKPAFRSDRPGRKPAFRSNDQNDRYAADGASNRPPFSADAKPFNAKGPRRDFDRPAGKVPMGRYNASDDDFVPTKTPGFRIEPVEDKPRSDRPRSGGFDRAAGGKSFRPRPEGARPSNPRPTSPRTTGPRPSAPRSTGADSAAPRSGGFGGGSKPFRSASGRPASGDREFRPSSRPGAGSEGRSNADRSARPSRFAPRAGGDGPPKKFTGSRPAAPGAPRTGPDGEPRIKERWRNSFTGKNKGRPKPKPKGE